MSSNSSFFPPALGDLAGVAFLVLGEKESLSPKSKRSSVRLLVFVGTAFGEKISSPPKISSPDTLVVVFWDEANTASLDFTVVGFRDAETKMSSLGAGFGVAEPNISSFGGGVERFGEEEPKMSSLGLVGLGAADPKMSSPDFGVDGVAGLRRGVAGLNISSVATFF